MRPVRDSFSILWFLAVSLGWLTQLAMAMGRGGESKWLFQGHGAVTEVRSVSEAEVSLGAREGGSTAGASPRLALFYAHVRYVSIHTTYPFQSCAGLIKCVHALCKCVLYT